MPAALLCAGGCSLMNIEEPNGYVYFLARPSNGSVKIGFSILPERRLMELQTGSDEALELLAYIPGTIALEQKFHRILRSSRLSGEWFAQGERLANLLGWVADRLREDADEQLRHRDALKAFMIHKFGRAA
jgi:Meiotically up-regulated gene 113